MLRLAVSIAAILSCVGHASAWSLKVPGGVSLRTSAASSRVNVATKEDPSFGELFKFTLTAMPIFVAPTLLSLIDTAFVGKMSADLAAMGPACAVVDSVSGLFVFVSVGATNAAARALDREEARRSATIGVGIGAVLGMAVGSIMLVCGGPSAFQSLPLAQQCSDYVRIRAFSMPAVVALMSAQASCLGAKDSASPARATVLASIVNIAGDALLVPRLGVAGAAWATVACQYVAAFACVKALASKGMIKLPLRPTKKEIKNFFAFGPFMIVLLCKMVTYNQAVLLAATLGPASSAAHQIVYSLSRFCFTLGDSTGATAQAYLPTFPALTPKVIGVSSVVAVVASAIALGAPSSFFTNDPQIAHLMRRIAPAAALGLLMHPIVVGLEGCLLARRDLGWLVRNYCATALASVVATSCFLRYFSFSLLDVWVYLASYQALRFATFLRRIATHSSSNNNKKTLTES